MQPIRTEEDAMELLRAVKALAVISAWSGLGLFEALMKGPMRLLDLPVHAFGSYSLVRGRRP